MGLAENYGPVYLMSVLGKLVKSVITRNTTFVEERALLKKNKHGFCKGKSCLEFIVWINKCMDNSDLIDILCLNF